MRSRRLPLVGRKLCPGSHGHGYIDVSGGREPRIRAARVGEKGTCHGCGRKFKLSEIALLPRHYRSD